MKTDGDQKWANAQKKGWLSAALSGSKASPPLEIFSRFFFSCFCLVYI
jgi:hypothetical protein